MKNFLTFRQLDSALIHKASLNENDIPQALRIVYINDKLMKIYRLLDGLNDPWYNKTALAVTVAGDVEILTEAVITSYTNSTSTIIRNAGTWKLGQVLVISIFTGGSHIADFVGIVASGAGTGTAVLTIVSGVPADMGANKITVTNIKSATGSAIDLSGLYVKDISRVYDNGYTGGKVRIFSPIADPAIFSVLHRDPFYDNRVAFYRRGDSIDLYVGSAATALGTVNFEYRGKPTPCSDFDTDVLVEIPPEDNQILMDEVLAEYLTHVGKPIPQDVANRNGEFQSKYDAAMQDIAKKQALVKGVRGS